MKQLAHQEARDAAAAAAEAAGGIDTAAGTKAAKAAASKVKRSYQPPEKLLAKYYGKISVEKYDGPKLLDGAASKIGSMQKKVEASRRRNTDKADRATTEQVLDPRTRTILYKMLNRGVFHEINGCISTGKEANVYQATDSEKGRDLAVKVFKTSILVFKDRDKYVTGEFRFRKGYNKHNPRKMVRKAKQAL